MGKKGGRVKGKMRWKERAKGARWWEGRGGREKGWKRI